MAVGNHCKPVKVASVWLLSIDDMLPGSALIIPATGLYNKKSEKRDPAGKRDWKYWSSCGGAQPVPTKMQKAISSPFERCKITNAKKTEKLIIMPV